MLQRGIVAVQFLDLILREIAHAHLARRAHLPFHRRQLRREQSRQRRLAIAVAPQQRDPVIGVNPQVQPLQYRLALGIADTREVQRHQGRFQFIGAWKVKT